MLRRFNTWLNVISISRGMKYISIRTVIKEINMKIFGGGTGGIFQRIFLFLFMILFFILYATNVQIDGQEKGLALLALATAICILFGV